MKSKLFAVILATLSAASWAGSDKAVAYSAEVGALRAECAASYGSKIDSKAKAANEYQFVYYKGEFKGEQRPGQALACTEGQYAAYLDKADPARVMAAYPTAAGRPSAKPAAK